MTCKLLFARASATMMGSVTLNVSNTRQRKFGTETRDKVLQLAELTTYLLTCAGGCLTLYLVKLGISGLVGATSIPADAGLFCALTCTLATAHKEAVQLSGFSQTHAVDDQNRG